MKNKIPNVKYAYIGGSGTWAGNFPYDINMEGAELLEDNLVFDTPYGKTVPFKLIKLHKDITADHEDRLVLTVDFHGWHSPDEPSGGPEQIFWTFMEAGVKNIVVEGSGGGVNQLLDPGDIIIPTDFIDFKKVPTTPLVANKIVRMLNPTCPGLRKEIEKAAYKEGFTRVFNRGVYGCSQGPRFESASEIRMMQNALVDIAGITLVPEIYYARLIGACLGSLYIISNYAEGLISDWRGESIFDIYKDCAPKIGRIMLSSLANVGKVDCHCAEYVTEVDNKVKAKWEK
jgi:5'-methylthioadenosine phosphorylase